MVGNRTYIYQPLTIMNTEHLPQKKIIVTTNHSKKLFAENFYDTRAFSLTFFLFFVYEHWTSFLIFYT